LWLVGSGAVLLHTVVKSVLLFVTAVVGFRLGERRTLAELAAFDFVAIISVGAIIGRTATAADSAFLTGAIALATILLTHRLITRLRYRPTFARLVDQQLRLLVVDGELRHDELRKTGLTEADVLAVLRQSPRAFRRVIEQEYQPWQAGLTSGLELQLGVGQLGAVADWRAIPETDNGEEHIRRPYRHAADLAGLGISGGEVGHVGDRVTGPRHRPLGRIHKRPTAGQPAQL
jgi:hypothetical protein